MPGLKQQDYKNSMKHKRKKMKLEDVIVHIRIEEKNRLLDKFVMAKGLNSKANLVEGSSNKSEDKAKKRKDNSDNKLKGRHPYFKKNSNCYNCGKPGHYAATCKKPKKDDYKSLKVNLVEGEVVAAVVSQINIVTAKEWVVDSGVTRHICGDKNSSSNYVSVKEGEEHGYMGESRPSPVNRKRRSSSQTDVQKDTNRIMYFVFLKSNVT